MVTNGTHCRDRSWRSGAYALAAAVALVCAARPADCVVAEPLHVVATTSDLASLARAVAGEQALVEAIVPAGTDAEAFEPRPGDLGKLKGAALVVRVGLGYDHWLDKLLALHADPKVARGGPGYCDASLGVPLLELKGRSLDPAGTGAHAHGLANPHYWLDPANAEIITGGIVEAMMRVAPQLRDQLIARRDDFLGRLRTRLPQWQEQLQPFRGARVVAYHNTWPYFARRFRLDIVGVIESKEGVSPSPARLAALAALMRNEKVGVILHEPFEPEEVSQLLARHTGAIALKLAPSVGSLPEIGDYFSLFDHDVGTLARALSQRSS